MKKVEFRYIILMGIIMAFIGFLGENICQLIGKGYIDSRYYILPFIPGYSLIVFVWYFISFKKKELMDYDHIPIKRRIIYNILFFIFLCLSTFIVEIIYGNLVDKLFQVSLWDYNNIPTHVTKYASLITSLVIGTVSYILIKVLFPKMYIFISKIDRRVVLIIDIIIGTLLVLDTLLFYYNLIFKHIAKFYWKLNWKS